MPRENSQVVATRYSRIDKVLKDKSLSCQERNEVFQEYLESDKFKVKPREKHPSLKRKEETDSDR